MIGYDYKSLSDSYASAAAEATTSENNMQLNMISILYGELISCNERFWLLAAKYNPNCTTCKYEKDDYKRYFDACSNCVGNSENLYSKKEDAK